MRQALILKNQDERSDLHGSSVIRFRVEFFPLLILIYDVIIKSEFIVTPTLPRVPVDNLIIELEVPYPHGFDSLSVRAHCWPGVLGVQLRHRDRLEANVPGLWHMTPPLIDCPEPVLRRSGHVREAAASQLKLDVSWRRLWSDPEIMLKLLLVSKY